MGFFSKFWEMVGGNGDNVIENVETSNTRCCRGCSTNKPLEKFRRTYYKGVAESDPSYRRSYCWDCEKKERKQKTPASSTKSIQCSTCLHQLPADRYATRTAQSCWRCNKLKGYRSGYLVIDVGDGILDTARNHKSIDTKELSNCVSDYRVICEEFYKDTTMDDGYVYDGNRRFTPLDWSLYLGACPDDVAKMIRYTNKKNRVEGNKNNV